VTEEVVIDVLLGVAVVIVLLCATGLLAMRDVYQRLHFVAPISLVAPVLVAIAVTVKEGWDENTAATWLALGFVVLASPFLSHATVRTARIRERGDWRPERESGPEPRAGSARRR
jgi:multisubunit Na+/H+ antiporter MnhG subunit